MSRAGRPLVVKRYGETDLARGMAVIGGTEGKIRVVARHGQLRRHRDFALDVPLVDRLAWQHAAIEALRLKAAGKINPDATLDDDIDAYLESLEGRKREDAAQWLDYWREWFGSQPRHELTLQQCQAFFQAVRPHTNADGTFSASSKNKLRTYLINVWRYHDGRRHECPVLDVPLFDEPAPQARELPADTIQRILAALPDTPDRARLGLLYVTGCRPGELRQLTPDRFALDEQPPYVRIVGAKGGRSRMVPLPPVGVAYARDFMRHQAWAGGFNIYRTMQRGAEALGLPPLQGQHPGGRRRATITPYALRHAYAMNLRRSGAGIDDIADALGHASLQTTRRYAQAIPERQAQIVGKMWERVGG